MSNFYYTLIVNTATRVSCFAGVVTEGSAIAVVNVVLWHSWNPGDVLNNDIGKLKKAAQPTGKRNNAGESGKLEVLKKPWMMRVPHPLSTVLPFLPNH